MLPFRTLSATLQVQVFDNYQGNFALEEWRYTLHNLTYSTFDPALGVTDGIGTLILGPLRDSNGYSDYGNFYAAPGFFHAGTLAPPAIQWVDPFYGGLRPGQTGVFGFTTLPRPVLEVSQAAIIDSIYTNGAHGPFGYFESTTALAPGVIPEPATAVLLPVGAAALYWWRKRHRTPGRLSDPGSSNLAV